MICTLGAAILQFRFTIHSMIEQKGISNVSKTNGFRDKEYFFFLSFLIDSRKRIFNFYSIQCKKIFAIWRSDFTWFVNFLIDDSLLRLLFAGEIRLDGPAISNHLYYSRRSSFLRLIARQPSKRCCHVRPIG